MDLQSIGIAFIHGLISAMSACVYPLIPITTALFGAGKTSHWVEGLFLSAVYVCGMAITYVALGIIAALTGTIFGSYMGSPFVIIFFTIIFFYLALSFLDILPLPIPNFANALHVKKSKKIYYPFILGVFSGFIAAPCTAPLYGAILIDIAKNAALNKSLVPGITQALFFSLGMGSPFLLIGGFALKLPKPGRWLRVVKYVGALVLLTAGFHYIEDLIGPYPPESSKGTMAILGIVLCIVFFILSEPLSKTGEEEFDKTARQKAGVVFFLLISAFGLFLATSLLKPGQNIEIQTNGAHTSRADYTNLDTAMKSVGSEDIILVDFWAEWCTACHKMDEELFPSSEFNDLIKKYHLVIVRLDYTEMDNKEKEGIIQKYKIPGFPTLLLIDKNGNEIDRSLGFRNKEETIKILDDIISKKNDVKINRGKL